MKPLNTAAETIVTLNIQNKDIDQQILELAKIQARNNETIEGLGLIAEWEEDQVVS